VPGPIIEADRNQRLAVEFDNSALPGEDLFEIDDRVPGTSSADYHDYDGPVPDVRTVVYQHGLDAE
jgi:spore coat protein A